MHRGDGSSQPASRPDRAARSPDAVLLAVLYVLLLERQHVVERVRHLAVRGAALAAGCKAVQRSADAVIWWVLLICNWGGKRDLSFGVTTATGSGIPIERAAV